MINYIYLLLTAVFCYCVTDKFLPTTLNGKYYLLHFINNAIVVYLTFPDIISIYTDFPNFWLHEKNIISAILTTSLHIYHVIVYFNKLRVIDWMHHILNVFISLPIALIYPSGSLIGHSMFFMSGLPGGLDYLLLFLERNAIINRSTEKRINTYLNVWIRAPGCNAHAAFILIGYNIVKSHVEFTVLDLCIHIFVALVVYWNGNYFMRQVVENNITDQLKSD
jgi:hypothetical protein